MARNVIDGSHFVKKLHIDLKWPEMRSKVNFGHPKCFEKKVLYLSEMARNAIESEF